MNSVSDLFWFEEAVSFISGANVPRGSCVAELSGRCTPHREVVGSNPGWQASSNPHTPRVGSMCSSSDEIFKKKPGVPQACAHEISPLKPMRFSQQ